MFLAAPSTNSVLPKEKRRIVCRRPAAQRCGGPLQALRLGKVRVRHGMEYVHCYTEEYL